MPDFLSAIQRHAAPGQVTGILRIPPRPERTAEWPDWVPPALLDALRTRGLDRPWTHQAEAAALIRSGIHTVVSTGTGSGKSLAAWVPALSLMIRNAENPQPASRADATSQPPVAPPSNAFGLGRTRVRTYSPYRPTVLYLAPTKALAADQFASIASLARDVDPRIGVAVVDGDSAPPERAWAREHASIFLSNPDFAHHVMLAGHRHWTRLWRGLSMVVVDEFHSYRGVFGAHVAATVRRLLRMAAHYGASATVVFLSATSGDPRETAHRFLGPAFGPVRAVDDDGSPSGPKTIVMWRCREQQTPSTGARDVGFPSSDSAASSARSELDSSKRPGRVYPTASTARSELQANGTRTSDSDGPSPDAPRRAAVTEAGELTGLLVAEGAQTLTFVRSRPGSERVAEIARNWLTEHAREFDDPGTRRNSKHDDGPRLPTVADAPADDESSAGADVLACEGPSKRADIPGRADVLEREGDPTSVKRARSLPERVASYRGGYLPEDRRELEEALRSGRIRALASTNALESGIDVAGLDAVVVTGWPGTHASFAQQIGRAGRAGREGLAVFVGRDNPLDQYLLSHPEVMVSSPAEANVFDPGNPHVLVPHLCAAAAELPLTEADADVFGLADTSLFDDLAADGMLRRRPAGWFWNALGIGAHEAVDLRGEGTTVTIVDGESGAVLGTVDSSRADATVFPGAVYLHQGVPYRVEDFVDDVAVVRRELDGLRTFAREETSVDIVSTVDEADLGIGVWAQGEVLVSSRVVGYDVRRAEDGTHLGRVPLTMPVRRLHTQGTWWTMDSTAIAAADVDPASLPGALHAAEHAAIGMLPLLATCDRWDLGGLSTAMHTGTGRATVIVHDAIPGGSGCARRGFDRRNEWAESALEALLDCPCTSGCPRCVQSPKCGNNNEPLSKSGAIRLLSALSRATKTLRPPRGASS